jgi:hypothetical protein
MSRSTTPRLMSVKYGKDVLPDSHLDCDVPLDRERARRNGRTDFVEFREQARFIGRFDARLIFNRDE